VGVPGSVALALFCQCFETALAYVNVTFVVELFFGPVVSTTFASAEVAVLGEVIAGFTESRDDAVGACADRTVAIEVLAFRIGRHH
jgi:hypothetical protein